MVENCLSLRWSLGQITVIVVIIQRDMTDTLDQSEFILLYDLVIVH